LKPLILFRFYKDLECCRERIKILRHYNPDVPIAGLFGGPKDDWLCAVKRVAPLLDALDLIENPDAWWKWRHADLAIRDWYSRTGHRIAFEFLVDHEWDLLLLQSVLEAYPNAGPNVAVFTALQRLDAVRDWWWWTGENPRRAEAGRFHRFLGDSFGLSSQTWVCLGAGPALPRRFLDRLAAEELPAEIFDPLISELVLPGLAEAFRFTLLDSGFHPPWPRREGLSAWEDTFNCIEKPIAARRIRQEFARADGRRVFHPVKYEIQLADLMRR
jgi:hypothetical protein